MADRITDAELALAQDSYGMLRAGDPAFLERFDPEIEWHVPDTLPAGGDLRGITQVLEFLTTVTEHFDVADPEPEEFLPAGDRLVVLGTWHGRARSTGARVDIPFAHVWQYRDGKAVYFRNYIDAAKALEAL